MRAALLFAARLKPALSFSIAISRLKQLNQRKETTSATLLVWSIRMFIPFTRYDAGNCC